MEVPSVDQPGSTFNGDAAARRHDAAAKNPAPAKVPPMEFAAAIEDALEKVVSLPIDQKAIEATANDIRQVAMEARNVVAESYSKEELEEFQDYLAVPFSRAMPSKFGAARAQ